VNTSGYVVECDCGQASDDILSVTVHCTALLAVKL